MRYSKQRLKMMAREFVGTPFYDSRRTMLIMQITLITGLGQIGIIRRIEELAK